MHREGGQAKEGVHRSKLVQNKAPTVLNYLQSPNHVVANVIGQLECYSTTRQVDSPRLEILLDHPDAEMKNFMAMLPSSAIVIGDQSSDIKRSICGSLKDHD